jgi:hypothetical protein
MSNCNLKSFEVTNTEYLNVSGKKKRRAVAAVNAEFVIGADEDCGNLMVILEKLEIEKEKLNQQQAAKGKAKVIEAALRQVAVKRAEVLKKMAEGKCEKVAAAEESEKEQKETLELLKSQTAPTGMDKNTKTIAYGLAGLVVVVALVVLFKRN